MNIYSSQSVDTPDNILRMYMTFAKRFDKLALFS